MFSSENCAIYLTRIIQSLYYSPASRCINAWMHSLKKSVKPEIVNRYDLWVLRHKIGGAKVFVNNVQWSDKGNNKITELRTILQRESPNS